MITHGLSDEESEEALLDLALEPEQDRLDRLAHADLVGLTMFGSSDDWLDKRLGDT